MTAVYVILAVLAWASLVWLVCAVMAALEDANLAEIDDEREPVRLPVDIHNQLVIDLAAYRLSRSGPDFDAWSAELAEITGEDA